MAIKVSGSYGASNERINQALNYYLSQGLTPLGASYLVGNMIQESSMRTNVYSYDGMGSLGLIQWTAERKNGMPSTFEGQLAFALTEMNRDGKGISSGIRKLLSNPNATRDQLKSAFQDWIRWGVEGERFIYGDRLFAELSGQPIPPANPTALPGDYGGGSTGSGIPVSNAFSAIKSAIFGQGNCPPPPYTQQDRIIYTGCQNKIQSAQQAGTAASGYPAPAVGSTGAAEAGLGSKPYGGQLKPGGFIKPANAPVNSPYGWRGGRMHRGIDIAAPKGTPIYASADGVVKYTVTGCYLENTGIRSGDECGGGGYGNQIGLDHAGGFFTLYGHLHKIMVKEGDQVKQGQQIAEMGSTGSSTGYHIHFELRKGGESGERLNPEHYF